MRKNIIWKIIIALLSLALIVVVIIFGLPFAKLKIFEQKIKKDLIAAYPGASISGIHGTKKSVSKEKFCEDYSYYWLDDQSWDEELYVFEVDLDLKDDDYLNPILGLATADGDVVFDEYAFVYYRDDLKSYVMDMIDPEENFPGVEFEYYDRGTGNEKRLVETDRCSTLEGFLDTENVGISTDNLFARDHAGCAINVKVDPYDSDLNLETCQKLAEVLTEGDCRVYIDFNESYTGHQISLGRYYPDNDVLGYGRFTPYDQGTKMNWTRTEE